MLELSALTFERDRVAAGRREFGPRACDVKLADVTEVEPPLQ